MARKTPIGKLPAETAADRRTAAQTLTTPAGQARVAAFAANITTPGRYEQNGQEKTISPTLARRFWKASAK